MLRSASRLYFQTVAADDGPQFYRTAFPNVRLRELFHSFGCAQQTDYNFVCVQALVRLPEASIKESSSLSGDDK